MATAVAQTGTQADGGPKAPFPPFNQQTYGSQLIWLAVAFVALYVLLSRVALPRIAGIFAARRGRIAGDLAEAGRLKSESDAAIEAYEKALAEARARAQAIAAKTREEFATTAEQRKKSLEADLAGKLADAERRIASAKEQAMAGVRVIAVDTASEIVKTLLGDAPPKPNVERAVDASLH